MPRLLSINFDNVLFGLVCGYAFFIPLEQILDVWFGIDTVLKPYRVFALLIIGIFAIKLRFRATGNPQLKYDLFLYGIFAYGLIITGIRMVTSKFHLGYLFNDTFQLGLYLAVFVIMRHINLSMARVWTIIKFLSVGIVLNAMRFFYEFHILQTYTRTGGFMDNPNYLALSLAVLLLLIITQRVEFNTLKLKALWWFLLLFCGYVLILAGSATSLVVLAGCLVFLWTLYPLRQKIRLAALLLGLGLALGGGGWAFLQTQAPLLLAKRVQNKRNKEDNRMPLWKGVIRASQDSYFTGLGVGQFKGNFYRYYPEENNDLIRRIVQRNYFLSPHSDYLALLVVYGIVGLLCYLAFVFLSGRALLRNLRTALAPEHKRYYQFALMSLVALVLFGIGHENLNSALFWILLSNGSKVAFN